MTYSLPPLSRSSALRNFAPLWITALIVVLVASGYFLTKKIVQQTAINATLQAQKDCSTFLLPPTRIVFINHTRVPETLVKQNELEIAFYRPHKTLQIPTSYGYFSPPTQTLSHTTNLIQYRWPTVFLHQRKTPAGFPCILHVSATEGALMIQTFERLTPNHPLTAGKISLGVSFGNAPSDKPLILLAGQPDHSNPSRFTIGFEYDGQPGMLTGTLNDDKSVSFTSTLGRVDTKTSLLQMSSHSAP